MARADYKRDLKDIIETVKAYINLEQKTGITEVLYSQKDAGKTKKTLLAELRERALKCGECSLCKTRTNLVFGTGDPDAEIMFIGEAPGYEEDMQGLPFVGRAGQLLTKIIAAMGYERKDVYIANVLKCRPPQNRSPLPGEVSACQGNLRSQINIIRPKVVCSLGKFSASVLLGVDSPITKLRGRFYDYNGVKVMPTFHPAYLLRNPSDKKLVWQDMKKIMAYLKEGRSDK